jgi:squalene-hopene/tetraprenyl-beta-curcumene cyclase
MNRRALHICLVLAVGIAGTGLWKVVDARASAGSPVNYLTTWSPKAAADYLDRREVWWQQWPAAKIDHGTICVSCHTVVPYAMARHLLSGEMHEDAMPAPQKILMENVEKRVTNWSEMVPFYSDAAYGLGKTAESHATEAVANAVILASFDTQQGHLRPITRTAFDEAWALQEETGENAGGWKWQDFHLAPWESAESGYQGATLLMLAIENAPDGYASEPQIRGHLERLRQYLHNHYAAQPLMNQLYVLWLSTKVSSLLTSAEQKSLLDAVQSHQQSDGGWSLFSLDPRSGMESDQWKRLKGQLKEQISEIVKPLESDGYATGLVAVVLEESGTSRQDPELRRALEWLDRHQGSDGSWRAYSLNEKRDPESDIGRFMSDAATAYSTMALENGRPQPAGK